MRTVVRSLPLRPYSGQYSTTGASTSRRPRDTSTCAHSAVAPLVQLCTMLIESSPNVPPHTSTTVRPSWVMQSVAPVSPRSATLRSNASTTGCHRSSQVPSAIGPVELEPVHRTLRPPLLEDGVEGVDARRVGAPAEPAAALALVVVVAGRARVEEAVGRRPHAVDHLRPLVLAGVGRFDGRAAAGLRLGDDVGDVAGLLVEHLRHVGA